MQKPKIHYVWIEFLKLNFLWNQVNKLCPGSEKEIYSDNKVEELWKEETSCEHYIGDSQESHYSSLFCERLIFEDAKILTGYRKLAKVDGLVCWVGMVHKGFVSWIRRIFVKKKAV